MSTFNATEYLEAIKVPAIRIHNRTIKGVILSFDQYLPFYERAAVFAPDNVAKIETELEAINLAVDFEKMKAEFFRAVFPKKWIYIFTIDPVDYLLRKPKALQDEAFGNFFSTVAVAHGLPSLKRN